MYEYYRTRFLHATLPRNHFELKVYRYLRLSAHRPFLLPPDYPVPYAPVKAEYVMSVLNRISTYLETASPVKVIDRQSKTEITDMTKLTSGSIFEPGVFRLISYEWGVAYGAMLLASEATGDSGSFAAKLLTN